MFGSERLTGALLDRLMHNIHILEMNGESYRLNWSRGQREPTAGRPNHFASLTPVGYGDKQQTPSGPILRRHLAPFCSAVDNRDWGHEF